MALTIPPYVGQGWIDNSEPDLSAENLNAVDAGITANSNAINAIANAVVSQIINDPNKIASMAALYAVNQTVTTINSNLAGVSNNLNNKFDTSRIRTAAGVFNDTSTNQLFNISGSSSGNTYLLAAQIQLSTGTWSDLRTMDGITRIDCNTLQVNVIKSSAAIYAGYYVRFVLLD